MQNKVVFITDMLPTEEHTAGVILESIRRITKNDLDLNFILLHNPNQNYKISSQIPDLALNIIIKPLENFKSANSIIPKILSFIALYYLKIRLRKKFKKELFSVINRLNPDIVVWVIESITSVLSFINLSQEITSKQYALFWDPFEWWAEEHGFNPSQVKRIKSDLILSSSKMDLLILPNEDFFSSESRLLQIKKIILHPFYEK